MNKTLTTLCITSALFLTACNETEHQDTVNLNAEEKTLVQSLEQKASDDRGRIGSLEQKLAIMERRQQHQSNVARLNATKALLQEQKRRINAQKLMLKQRKQQALAVRAEYLNNARGIRTKKLMFMYAHKRFKLKRMRCLMGLPGCTLNIPADPARQLTNQKAIDDSTALLDAMDTTVETAQQEFVSYVTANAIVVNENPIIEYPSLEAAEVDDPMQVEDTLANQIMATLDDLEIEVDSTATSVDAATLAQVMAALNPDPGTTEAVVIEPIYTESYEIVVVGGEPATSQISLFEYATQTGAYSDIYIEAAEETENASSDAGCTIYDIFCML